LWKGRRDVHLYAWPLSILGNLLALYHLGVQYEIIPEAASPCVQGVPCSSMYIHWLGFITIPFLSLIAFSLINLLLCKSQLEKQEQLIRPHSVTFGPSDAKVTLVEFLDPECESCRAFFPFVKQLLDEYKNDLRLVIRYAPFHPNATQAIKIMEAARKQDKYW